MVSPDAAQERETRKCLRVLLYSQFPEESTTHHARPLGFSQEVEEDRGTICKHFYSGFYGKKQVRQNNQTLGWLVWVISAGSVAQGLSLAVWYLLLRQLDI